MLIVGRTKQVNSTNCTSRRFDQKRFCSVTKTFSNNFDPLQRYLYAAMGQNPVDRQAEAIHRVLKRAAKPLLSLVTSQLLSTSETNTLRTSTSAILLSCSISFCRRQQQHNYPATDDAITTVTLITITYALHSAALRRLHLRPWRTTGR